MHATDKVLIHKNIRSVRNLHQCMLKFIGQSDVNHIMTSSIKTITLLLKALTDIITNIPARPVRPAEIQNVLEIMSVSTYKTAIILYDMSLSTVAILDYFKCWHTILELLIFHSKVYICLHKNIQKYLVNNNFNNMTSINQKNSRFSSIFLYVRLETGHIMWLGMAGGRPHRVPHNKFSSVYRIFTKLGHIISLWKGKNPIYFGVIRSKIKVTITINRIFNNRVVSTW
jgi:hypothetical protein